MKQLDYETSNYKYKEDVKTFVSSFNELVDKYIKGSENLDAELKKVTANIEKKNAQMEKLDATLLDLGNKTSELVALKELSNEEIRLLNEKKSTISYTDSEVQKMELDDINAQIAAKKGKISKIDAKIDATKAKVKSSNDEKKSNQKELSALLKDKKLEEETMFRAEALLELIKGIKEEMNSKSLEIVNAPYKSIKEEVVVPEMPEEEPEVIDANKAFADIDSEESFFTGVEANDNEEELITIESTMSEPLKISEEIIEMSEADLNDESAVVEEVTSQKEEDIVFDQVLKDKFEKEGLKVQDFSKDARDKMLMNKDAVIKNMDILKKHKVPLSYTVDQPEVFYDISAQDLDDLLSIITTDDEGNGMGFTIDFTFNILSELSKINVDKLIDVYNEEFMNVNAKSGIIYLLKMTNPQLTEFEKNRKTNIEILKGLGTHTVDEVIEKHPEFVNMDNPLFVNVLNVFDKNDLVEKLNADVDVVTKIIEYWKNN